MRNTLEGIGVRPGAGSGPGEATARLLSAPLKTGRPVKTAFLFLLLSCFAPFALSQDAESTLASHDVKGAVSMTNKGISTIPSFTLGKPAVVFDMSMGTGKLSFEPTLRFALEGKPWTFLFWWRYKVLEANKFKFIVGAHPALSFKTTSQVTNGVVDEVIVARRFLAGELSSSYSLAQNVSLGTYYLYSRGLETSTTRNTHYVGLNWGLSNPLFSNQVMVSVHPQVYYLQLDENDGFYFTSRFALEKRNSPFSISAIINKTIQTNISEGEDFIWNVSVIYSFDI